MERSLLMVSIQLTREVDYRQAERTLKRWLTAQGMGIMNCQEWNRWHYNNRPFWSVWGLIYGNDNEVFINLCGIHIYDDGEVIIVAKNIRSDTEDNG